MQWLIERIKAVMGVQENEAWSIFHKIHQWFAPKWERITQPDDVEALILTTAEMMGLAV